MKHRLFRAALFGACVLAIWLVAGSALARTRGFSSNPLYSHVDDAPLVETNDEDIGPREPIRTTRAAPFCDERGATRIAPLPPLDGPTDSVAALEGSTGKDCEDGAEQDNAVRSDRRDVPRRVASDGDAALPPAVWKVLSPEASPAFVPDERAAASAGVHTRIERPPRNGVFRR